MFNSAIVNKLKSYLIVALVFALLSVVVYYISYALGYGQYAVRFAIGFSLITSFLSYWNSDKIVISMNRAHHANQQQQNVIENAISNVCISAGIDMPKLYVMDDPSPNAFATGRNPKHAAVCVTTGLLDIMNRNQLEGVLAHEVAHIKNYDILLSTVVSVMIGAVVMLSDIWTRSLIFGGRRRSDDRENGNALLAVIGLIFVIIAPIAGQLMRFALSRNREYLADATAIKFTQNPEGLASALEKIGGISKPVRNASNATSNMYFSDPLLAANGKRTMSKLFATHPPIEERVARIRNLY